MSSTRDFKKLYINKGCYYNAVYQLNSYGCCLAHSPFLQCDYSAVILLSWETRVAFVTHRIYNHIYSPCDITVHKNRPRATRHELGTKI